MSPLPPSFYNRDALEVAYDLIGCTLSVGEVSLRVTEVEAYRFPGDSANHARFGRTDRNAPMWGPPGHAYIYLCYGLHRMLNLVTGPAGEAAAVLIRAAQPLQGLEQIQQRRGGKSGPVLLTGPGKVGEALALRMEWSGRPLNAEIQVFAAENPAVLAVGPRVGISYATEVDRTAPWRVAEFQSAWVSLPKQLKKRDSDQSHYLPCSSKVE